MKNTIIFTGADLQSGTTMISLAAAELLAKDGKSVLYICAGFWPVKEFLPPDFASASGGLMADLLSEKLTEHEVRQASAESRGVDVLGGMRNGTQGLYYRAEDLKSICAAAGNGWDWIVIDGGCVLLSSVFQDKAWEGCRNFRIITQQEKAVKRYQEWMRLQNGSSEENLLYILNKYTASGAFYTRKEMGLKLCCSEEDILTVPYIPYGWQAEAAGYTLLNFRSFRKAVERLTDRIKEDEADGII